VDIYKLIINSLDAPRLARIIDLAAVPPGELLDGVSTDPAYHATFAGKSADMVMKPGEIATFQMFYANTGTVSWVKGEQTEARLVVAGPRGYSVPREWSWLWAAANVYATQFQTRVDPGSLGGFTFLVHAPATARPGHYRFYARPAITGVGALTPETRANSVAVVEDPS